ncbi:MAG: hypothetical protein E5W70_08550 [Mesorhizobium sp.]|nr:MAG: hypothetical protein E5W70_08550 [Mesorhizobium sp.]
MPAARTNFGFATLAGIDLHQSADAPFCYTGTMKLVLAQLRLLLAVILLVAGGAVAGPAAPTSAIEQAGVAAPSTTALHKATVHIASTDQDNHRAPCDGCLDCMHSTGSGCCAAGISAGGCDVLHRAPVAIRFMAGKAFPAMGVKPDALLQPPRIFG